MNNKLLLASAGFIVMLKSMDTVSGGILPTANKNEDKTIYLSCFKKEALKRANFGGGDKLDYKDNLNVKIKLPILMYHYVEYVKDKKDTYRMKMNIQPDIFERHLQSLQTDGYTGVFVRDISKVLNGEDPQCTKSVALTFDDGYSDFYNDVFPLLKKYNMKATVYIIGNYIGQPDFLTEEQIKELVASGLVEIGAHTMDHLMLDKIDRIEMERQVRLGKEYLERRFGIDIQSFAYPFGSFNENVLETVKRSGYTSAVTINPGIYQSQDSLFALDRLRPEKFDQYHIGASVGAFNR